MNRRTLSGVSLAVALSMILTTLALASSVDVAVVDVTAPTGSVTLTPGGSGSITINMVVTGNQVGTATFTIYRDWTLAGDSFTGSNPQTFTVGPRAAQDPPTTFSTSGIVSIAAGQGSGTFTLAVSAIDITNSNQTGAKLSDGADSSYQVTVIVPGDITPPIITPDVSGTLGDNGWYVSDVTVSWTVTDLESAITSKSGCGSTTINTDKAGITLTCSATSAGGTSSQSVTIKRDATPPTINASVSPARPGSWWNIASGAPTVSFTCSDATSGLAGDCPDDYTFGEGEDQDYSKDIYDNAGNSASAGVSDIDVDLTAPTISASVSPLRPASGWWNKESGAPTVSFTCSDATSGLAGACPAAHAFPEGEDQIYSQTIYDNAGNSASVGVSDIDVDLTAPTITWNGGPADGGSYYFGFVPAAPTCTAADLLSGPGVCLVTGYSSLVGSHTMTATAYDLAGNTKVETRTYEVLAWTLKGFYQPVDMRGVLNVVKNGSTVPLKFNIFAGPTELTDVGAVKSLKYALINCDATQPQDEIETLATGGTVLRYDFTGGQFIFNWQTPKTAGKCYQVTMTTLDGSSLVAYFKLK